MRRAAWLAATAVVLAGAAGSNEGVAQANPPERLVRMLPLELKAPPTGRAGQPLAGISVRLHNPGTEAPDARLRLIIHEKDRGRDGHRDLNPDNVKVEVLEAGMWKPVLLGVMDGSVMGAIGGESAARHSERHRRGGFQIREGFDRRWPLRLTFGAPGTYTLVVAVSPDNGSRHLAQPAHSTIEVN